MQVLHTPAIFEGGLRRAVVDYMAAPAEQYQSILWLCGKSGGSATVNTKTFSGLPHLNFSIPMIGACRRSPAAQIVHYHGCWSLTSAVCLLLKVRHGLPLIYSPHGAFIPASLARGGAIKRTYLWGWERHVLARVDCFHAVSRDEASSMRGLAAGPIAVVPSGIDVENISLLDRQPDYFDRWGIPPDSFKVLFLSRLVPDKGADLLLHAFARLGQRVPSAHCIIAGKGSPGYEAQLEKLAFRLGVAGRITFTGQLDGGEKFAVFRNADVFVLPSRNEAQGLVVMEALSQNLPVLASCNTPWPDLVDAGCGWWEDNNSEALADALAGIHALGPDTRRAMGERGRPFLARHYSLAQVHSRLARLYAWVLGGKQPDQTPDFVTGAQG